MKNWRIYPIAHVGLWERRECERENGVTNTIYSKDVYTGTLRASEIYGNTMEEVEENAIIVASAREMLNALIFISTNIKDLDKNNILQNVNEAIKLTKQSLK
jgi:hypothetical protein